ncbi:MAG: hypothetical protein VXY93_15335, partial [Pseudomonadota bacterium]|nr:hypothetical protein [Pseudomonadota bacterium]
YGDTSSTRLTNWIDTQFGASYIIKVYKGDPNSGGVNLSAAGSGANDGWFFDYSAGVLNFNDTNVPSGVTDTNIYIVGYRYIGQTGAPTSGISTFSYLDLTVERNLDVGIQGGISTFRNNIDLNADLDVDGHTNLDNVSIAGFTTITQDLDVDGHTNLDNVNIAGVTTIGPYLKLRSFATGGSPQFTAAELRVLKIDGSTGGPMIQLMQNGADREEIQFFTTLFAAEFQKDGRLLLNKNFQVTGVSTFT